jgi:hypothetical protein
LLAAALGSSSPSGQASKNKMSFREGVVGARTAEETTVGHANGRGVESLVEAIVRSMRLMGTRMSWGLQGHILGTAGIPVRRGPKETLESFVLQPHRQAALERSLAIIGDWLTAHTHVGAKQVRWYDLRSVSPRDQDRILSWANSVVPGEFVDETFNVIDTPTSLSALEPQRDGTPKLVSVHRDDDKLYLQYFAVRSFSKRETVDLSELTEEQREPFEEYFEVIGVKQICLPCFDTVVIDFAARRVEARIDNLSNLRSDSQDAAHSRVMEEANNLIGAATTFRPLGLWLTNFFPAVGRLYRNRKAGAVNMLGFVALSEDTSSNNRGQPLRRKGSDLRKDKFHLGGRQNVSKINPYSIMVSWPSDPERLSITLEGGVRLLYKAGAITEASFDGCATYAEYAFLSEQLFQHLQ